MPSTLVGGLSLSIENASSSELTLQIMTVAALVFTPVVLLYTAWTYWIFRGAAHAAHPRSSRGQVTGGHPMRPFDPRLLRTAPPSVAVLAVVGVLQGVATIGLAFALAALVVAVVEGIRQVPRRGSRCCSRPSGPRVGLRAGRRLGRGRGDAARCARGCSRAGCPRRPSADRTPTGRSPSPPRARVGRAVCRPLPPGARRRRRGASPWRHSCGSTWSAHSSSC